MTTNRAFRFILAALSAGGGLHSAAARDDDSIYPEGIYGWYEAGPAFVENAKLQDYFGNPVNDNSVKIDPGFHFGIAIGRELTPYIKVEIETGFNYNALNSIAGATASSANLYRVPVLGNLVLQYPNRTGLIPTLGVGVGAQWIALDAQNIVYGATTMNETSATWVFGYQGYAGVRYEFRPDMSLGLFYHYSVADGPSWTSQTAQGNLKLDSLRSHTISLTFGWLF